MVYRADQTLRALTAAELERLTPEVRRELKRAQAAIEFVRAQNPKR
jgi:hypothetical protein